jgi:outer membrane protein assembly factor BamB
LNFGIRKKFCPLGLAVGVALVALGAHAANNDGPPSSDPAQLFRQNCAGCHDHPKDRIPPRAVIARRSPDEVMQILTNGSMRAQAAGLGMNDRVGIATYLTGKAPTGRLAPTPESNPCAAGASVDDAGAGWNGWGHDISNTRFQDAPGITAAQVPRLKLKWAFGYRSSYVYGQPTLVGGRVYVTSSSGRVYSLDANTGCAHWTFDAAGPVRTAVSIARVHGRLRAVFGDDASFVYALDAASGKQLWKRQLDTHPAARITGAPVIYAQRLYVPLSSLEELSAPTPSYECCKFRGSVVALDIATGRVLWRTYTIAQAPHPYRKNATGTQLYGPAGGSVWSAPTLDPSHDLLYVGTGNSYTDLPTRHTDSILALHMSTGAVAWANQLREHDNYIVGCDTPQSAGSGNCPHTLGPDVDFGTSPILTQLPSGERSGTLARPGRRRQQPGRNRVGQCGGCRPPLRAGIRCRGDPGATRRAGGAAAARRAAIVAGRAATATLQLGDARLPCGPVAGRHGHPRRRLFRFGGWPSACLCQRRWPCYLGYRYGPVLRHGQWRAGCRRLTRQWRPYPRRRHSVRKFRLRTHHGRAGERAPGLQRGRPLRRGPDPIIDGGAWQPCYAPIRLRDAGIALP